MSHWVDFTAIKLHISLAVALRQYQVRLRRSGRNQYRGLCPILSREAGMPFESERNLFHCFPAGRRQRTGFCSHGRITLREAAVRLQQQGGAAAPAGAHCPGQRLEKQ